MAVKVPFISLNDLEAIRGESVADPSALIVSIALDSACEAVRSYLGQNINRVNNAVEVHSGNARRKLRLRQRPVRDVTVVSVDEVVMDPTLYNVRGAVVTLTEGDVWAYGNDNVLVTYSYGWDIAEPTDMPVPADIRLVTLLVARRVYADVGTLGGVDIVSETIGDYTYKLSETAAVASASALLEAEKQVLDPYRIELVGDTPAY